MEGEYLIDCNRGSLKLIFHKFLTEKDEEFISYNQFFKFCCKVKLYPELISSSEIKRIIWNTLRKHMGDDRPLEIQYLHFEKILKTMAEHCFPTGNGIKFMITHIRGACQAIYNIPLTTVAPLNSVYQLFSPRSIVNNPVSTTRLKNTSVRPRKNLNNSASLKSYSSKVDLITPRNQTLIGKTTEHPRSPRLKIINIKNKVTEENAVKNINGIILKFIHTHRALVKHKKSKKILLKFVEKFIENQAKTVKTIQAWIYNASFQIWKIKSSYAKKGKL